MLNQEPSTANFVTVNENNLSQFISEGLKANEGKKKRGRVAESQGHGNGRLMVLVI